MKHLDLTCPTSFAEAFNGLPDSPEKPAVYRLANGKHVDIAYVRRDGSAVTVTGDWLGSETMRKAEKLG
ncbi:hypothetical protein [Marinobacter sp. JSM 1782161]|uniref:hypothetical protein n=1 Tax=Marinobacter sp. JSM 1782161 TaxID=2685906 RepID=UPI001402BCEE|nr:hypothetical protein [Marinobacter sp. JSM 1782161]